MLRVGCRGNKCNPGDGCNMADRLDAVGRPGAVANYMNTSACHVGSFGLGDEQFCPSTVGHGSKSKSQRQ